MTGQQYYKKDKKAMIYGKRTVSEGGGFPHTEYYPKSPAPIWCYASQLSQSLIFQAKSYGEEENRFFVFNQKTNVELYDLILYREKWYQVTRTDTADDNITDIYVYAKDCPKGDVPHDDEIVPE